MIDIQGILERLPHRHPFLLVDRVTELEPDRFVRGLKNVSVNEPFFVGHFPGRPVMPGVLIIEAMAQLAGVLALVSGERRHDDGTLFYLAGTDRARFKRPVVPGDQLRMEADWLVARRGMVKFDCRARVDDALACSAEITCVEKGA